MADQEKRGEVVPFKAIAKHPIRKPFVPLTGNPENGNYADWFDHLCQDSQLFVFVPPQSAAEKAGPK